MSINNILLSSLKGLYEKGRINGLFVVVIALLCNIKFGLEMPVSQKTVHIGFSELFIFLAFCVLLYLVWKERYSFEKASKTVCFLTVVGCSIFLVIAGYHVLLNNKSVYEFVGVFRNIYGFIVLFFLMDAGILKKEELVNGIFNIAVLYSLSVLSVVFYNSYIFDLSEYESYRWGRFIILEDDLTILGALMVMCLWLVCEEGRTKTQLAKTIFILASALVAAAESGSRSQAIPIMVLFILLPFVLVHRGGAKVIKIQILSLLAAVVAMACILTTSPNGNYLALKFFRGNPFIVAAVDWLGGGQRHSAEELAKNYGIGVSELGGKPKRNSVEFAENGVDGSEKNARAAELSTVDLMYHGSSSAARSSIFRVELMKIDLQILADSFILGTGQRVRSQTYLDGHVNSFYTPPNFMLHIALLAGVPSLLGYLALIGFVFVTLFFSKSGLLLYEKSALLLALMPIFGLSMFHDGLAGGALLNFILWLIISYVFLVYKGRVHELAGQSQLTYRAKVS